MRFTGHRCTRPRWLTFAAAVVALGAAARPVCAQSLDALIDEKQYLEGLGELGLPEVLDHYIATHPTDDPARQTYFRIARQRMLMREPGLSATQRAAYARTIIELRQSLIDARPSDARRVTWLSDQASAWMFDMFNVEAAGWTALFGSPTPRQRELAGDAAARAYELTQAAEQALAAVLLDIESQPGFAQDVAAQLQRQRLLELERYRRLPMIGGISAVTHAELNVTDRVERKRLYRRAVDALDDVINRTDGAAACYARLYRALAQVRLGDFEQAQQTISDMTASSGCNADIVLLGGLVSADAAGQRDGPDKALNALAVLQHRQGKTMTLLQRVLLTDQVFRWRRAAAMTLRDELRAEGLAEAYSAYLDLLQAGLNEPADVIRSIVVSRIANVADDSTPLQQLPPLVTISLAEAMAREPATRAEAIDLLQGVLERSELSDADRAAALYSLGRALYEDQQVLAATQRFLELAQQYPDDAQAQRAAELAGSLAFSLFERQKSAAEARRVLGEAVTLILEQYSHLRSLDRWRYIAGELAMYEHRFDDAAARFDAIGSHAEQYVDAQFMLGNVARLAVEAEPDQLKRLTLNERAVDVIQRVRPAVVSAAASVEPDSQRAASLRYYAVYLDVFEAQSLLELTDAARALEILQRVDLEQVDDAEARADVLLARIEAYQALGRAGEAQQQVVQYLDAAPEQVSQVLPPMMLEIERQVQELLDFGLLDDARARAHRELLPLANLLSRWLASNPQWRGDEYQLRRRMASAFELSGEYERALAEYERLLRTHPRLLVLLLGKAECLFQLGGNERLAEAIGLYKRIGATEHDHSAATYWQAQLRMLQILDRVGQNTHQIAPRIEQLQQRDPNLGGQRWQEGFNALRRKYR